MTKIIELFGIPTLTSAVDWAQVVRNQSCPYLERKCLKIRKNQPEISIGTCVVSHGIKEPHSIIICPFRFLERRQIFLDCIHLLALHEPGNELHCVPEVSIPGGSVDYFLISARKGRVIDFVGIELQALDTTGTLWLERQRFLQKQNVEVEPVTEVVKPYGINWKMTAKTILIQLHHKVQTFETLGKHLVMVLQDHLFAYMRREFDFRALEDAKLGNAMHFHAYSLQNISHELKLELNTRASVDSGGIAQALGLQANASVELDRLHTILEAKLSPKTLLMV